MPSNRTYELTIKLKTVDQGHVEILKTLLSTIGIKPHEIVEVNHSPQMCLSVYSLTLKKARAIKKKILLLRLKNISIALKSLLKKDWQARWKKEFKPFMLTDKVRVIPAWLKGKYPKGENQIYIDTTLAFGTGLHATTRFMSGFIAQCRTKFKTFLDIGTGTGILAMVAHHCDAQEISAVDISPDAVKTARRNFELNGCTGVRLRAMDFARFLKKEKYDFVAANLITHDLIKLKKKLVACVKLKQYLAVSGISLSNFELFRQTFKSLPLRCLRIEKSEGWVAVLYKRI